MAEWIKMDGVSFNADFARSLNEREFIEENMHLVWMDKPYKVKEKMLKAVYKIACGNDKASVGQSKPTATAQGVPDGPPVD